MIVKGFQKSYNLPIIVTRGNNVSCLIACSSTLLDACLLLQVYGPCQHPEKLISKLIYRALLGRPLQLHGDGSQLRGYVHVADVARAFDILTHYGRAAAVSLGLRTVLGWT